MASAALTPSLLTGRALAAPPNKGGHFQMAAPESSSSDSLDPTSYVSTYMMLVGYLWGNPLFAVDQKMKLVPELAESAEPSADAKKWVIKLRRGAEFHNGKSLTADDVVWSVNRHRAPEAASGMRPVLSQIVSVKATDQYEVTFELVGGNADWPYVLSDYHLMIQPQGVPTNQGIGTGPYVVEKFEPGVRILTKRNPKYWRDGVAHVDSVTAVGINNSTARVSALQTGEVDLVINVPPPIAPMLERGGFTVHRGDGTTFAEFVCHTKEPPFDNNDLRLALKYAINRQELVDKVFFGNGKIGNDHPIPSFFRFYAADLPQKTYDPDKAKFHYQKSGHSGPLPPLAAAQTLFNGGGLAAAELYQQQARRAGIEIPLQQAPDDGYWANVYNKRPFFSSGWFGRPTEDQMLTTAFQSGAPLNETQMSNPKLDQLLITARSELNEATRRRYYQDIQEIVAMEGGSVTPFFSVNLVGCTRKIQGFAQNPLGDGKFIENVYLAS
jgi:peptide/nickel transport system substrate-binding protein